MIEASYFDGKRSSRQRVTLSIEFNELVVIGEFGIRREAMTRVDVSEPMGDAPRTLRFSDGAMCETTAVDVSTLFAQSNVRDPLLLRIHRHWKWAIASFLAVAILLTAGYFLALPWIARTVAPQVPDSFVRTISEFTLQGLDQQILVPSKLSLSKKLEILASVEQLSNKAAAFPAHRLLFRSAPAIGANAFALPNGDIIVLDELAKLTENNDDIAAVIAHELGHVHHYHGMRQLIQSTFVSVVVGMYFGDTSSVIAGLGSLALESRYSREFESEADAFAGQKLIAAYGTAEPLARMLENIEKAHMNRFAAKKAQPGALETALSSHPDTEARTLALRAMTGLR